MRYTRFPVVRCSGEAAFTVILSHEAMKMGASAVTLDNKV
jgi:hypothetical protein